MSRVSITIDIPEEWMNMATEIANSLGTSQADVFRDALRQYMTDYEQEVLESEEALADFRAGRTLSHEEGLQRFAEHTRRVRAA